MTAINYRLVFRQESRLLFQLCGYSSSVALQLPHPQFCLQILVGSSRSPGFRMDAATLRPVHRRS